MRGRSLVPYLSGGADAVDDAETGTGWELFGRRAIRRGDWKALYLPAPYGPGAWQLYDLSIDPGEIDDLAAVSARQAGRASRALGRYVEDCGVIVDPISLFGVDPQSLS